MVNDLNEGKVAQNVWLITHDIMEKSCATHFNWNGFLHTEEGTAKTCVLFVPFVLLCALKQNIKHKKTF